MASCQQRPYTYIHIFISHKMSIKEVVETLERFAPLPLQEDYDNAGLQVGLTETEASGVLVCLDVTEEVVEEAARKGFNLIVAHHPLLFRGLKRISAETQVSRCAMMAVKNDIAIYAAHTNLDNAPGGVNFEIARRLGLQDVSFLQPIKRGEHVGGSGVVGELNRPMDAREFLQMVKREFNIDCLIHNDCRLPNIRRVALCGGAGEFLLDEAIATHADAFLTGEMGYHRLFGHEDDILIGVMGHYQSEQYTIDLIKGLLSDRFKDLPVEKTSIITNPQKYL